MRHPWWEIPLYRLFDFLSIGEPPENADCIFVVAGKQDRKTFGIELWRRDYAPELIISVGRFEWRRFFELILTVDDRVRNLVEQTPPKRRHFFVTFHGKRVDWSLAKIGRFGTMGEALALERTLEGRGHRTLMIISTSVHLRRAAFVYRQLFLPKGIRVFFVPVPEHWSLLKRKNWWRTPQNRSLVIKEALKYVLYRILGRLLLLIT